MLHLVKFQNINQRGQHFNVLVSVMADTNGQAITNAERFVRKELALPASTTLCGVNEASRAVFGLTYEATRTAIVSMKAVN